MPTYTKAFSYTTHSNKDVTHTLEIVEEPDVPNNRSMLTISIVRKNSGDEAVEQNYYNSVTCKLNDSEVYDSQRFSLATLAGKSEDKTTIGTYYIEYSSFSSRNFNISVKLKCDEIVNLRGWTLGIINSVYGTHASTEISGTCTPIDQSPPQISGLSVKADRYGLNASASFTAEHSSYNLYEVVFKISGLTSSQRWGIYYTHRYQYSQSDFDNTGHGQDYGYNSDGTYWVEIKLVYPIKSPISVVLDLDDRYYSSPSSLDSGGSYPWELTVTAYNGKSTTISGVLKVPQKVTGVSCEERLDINPGQIIALDYSVTPSNAELLNVTFTSSNSEIATVDGSGNVTAITEGPCTITVKTEDGGFTASCLVYVLDSSVFPILEPLERYFRASHLNRMILATQFIKLEIEEMSGEVPGFEIIYFSGRAEKVRNIFPILQSFYANCIRLKEAAEVLGVPVEGLPEIRGIIKMNAGWQLILNEWIAFLNKLHEKLTEV